MAGAAQRIKRERTLVWAGAMLTRMTAPPTLEDFIAEKAPPAKESMLAVHLQASARGLRAISLRDYKASKRAA